MTRAQRYLVTGGLGFLGSSLVRALIAAGHGVRVFDDSSRGAMTRLADVEGQFEMVHGDIRDPAAVAGACRDIDTVCHLAFVNGTAFFYSKPELVLDVGVRGMMNVLQGCMDAEVPELLLMSSSEVYQTPPTIPTPEEVPLSIPDVMNPRYSYAAGKIISEVLAVNYGRKHFRRVVTVRPHNVYGPAMGWEHVIPQFAVRLGRLARSRTAGDLPLEIQGSGQETRSFVYIDDFTRGVMTVLEHGEHMGIYHVGTMDEISIAALANEMATLLGRSISLIPGPAAAGGTARRCPDIAKVRTLGFEPRVSLREGLQLTVPWYVEHESEAPASV